MGYQYEAQTKHIRLTKGQSMSVCGLIEDGLILVDSHAQADCTACVKTLELNAE